MKFYPVPAADIHLLWDQAAPLIQQCADRSGEYTVADIGQRLFAHTAQLWAVMDGAHVVAAVVTEIARSECNILICAGSGRQGWVQFVDQIKDWARDQGCEKITLVGRKGWARLFRDWDLTAVILECAL